jgi:hypothetical protein
MTALIGVLLAAQVYAMDEIHAEASASAEQSFF